MAAAIVPFHPDVISDGKYKIKMWARVGNGTEQWVKRSGLCSEKSTLKRGEFMMR